MFNCIFHLACSKEHVTNGIDVPINVWESVNPYGLHFLSALSSFCPDYSPMGTNIILEAFFLLLLCGFSLLMLTKLPCIYFFHAK